MLFVRVGTVKVGLFSGAVLLPGSCWRFACSVWRAEAVSYQSCYVGPYHPHLLSQHWMVDEKRRDVAREWTGSRQSA